MSIKWDKQLISLTLILIIINKLILNHDVKELGRFDIIRITRQNESPSWSPKAALIRKYQTENARLDYIVFEDWETEKI